MKQFREARNLAEKAQVGFSYFLRGTLVVAMIVAIMNKSWPILFSSSLILFLTFLPQMFEKKYKIQIPDEFELGIIIFIYATLFLGEIMGYYRKYAWWDIVIHAGAGMALGFAGFMILYTLYHKNKIRTKPAWMSAFSFFFALGIGALWEIFEFTMDQSFGLNMQRSGLPDTMWDLIVDAGGALLTSAIGYYYFKKLRMPLFSRMFDKYLKENPSFFEETETKITATKPEEAEPKAKPKTEASGARTNLRRRH
ncbi:hypothetical protein JW826_03340 [Candidatus Woesearchaeota archaeon]|nr:hypothetical protein [Candidatus Woesearchaeota archaeon]